MTGERVGQWVLGPELGRGPAAVVYRAASATESGDVAAVKVFTHPLTRTPDFLARFPGELLALKRLSHPNVVRTFDAGAHAGHAWVATELVEGTDLASLVRLRGKAGLGAAGDVLRVGVQIARALKHGHNRSLLHRSLKPGNVFVTAAGVVKVADFGLAKLLPFAPTDLPADPWGTVGTLAPEQFTGKPVTRKSDLYALGGVLYAFATGRPMVQAATVAEFVHKHCYALPDRPAAFAPDLPPDLDDLICELIAKDPNRRPASAQAVVDELAQLRGKLERKGTRVAWPADPGDESGPVPALPAEAERVAAVRAPRPVMSRPAVVVPLFLLVVGLGVGLASRPRPGADELMAAARPLVASDAPADWDRAVDDYLTPLGERFPGVHAQEAAVAQASIRDRKALRRALAAAAAARPATPGEVLARRGLALLEVGDVRGARRAWAALAELFAPDPTEKRWVDLARAALAATADARPASPADPGSVRAAATTPAARAQLRDLFRDDPAALAEIGPEP